MQLKFFARNLCGLNSLSVRSAPLTPTLPLPPQPLNLSDLFCHGNEMQITLSKTFVGKVPV